MEGKIRALFNLFFGRPSNMYEEEIGAAEVLVSSEVKPGVVFEDEVKLAYYTAAKACEIASSVPYYKTLCKSYKDLCSGLLKEV